jgi:hypothetical protein
MSNTSFSTTSTRVSVPVFDYGKAEPPDLTREITLKATTPIAGGGYGDVYRGVWRNDGDKVEVIQRSLPFSIALKLTVTILDCS